MALDIEGKKYMNMQEQVAYLTNKVAELKEIIKDNSYGIKEIDLVDGHLIFTFNNGDEIDAGEVKSIASVSFNSQRHLILVYNTGESVDLGQVKGLTSISLDASKHMIVTYDDGTTSDLGLFKSLDHFALDGSYHLWVYYNNGTSEDLGAVISGTIDFSTLDLVAQTLDQTQANWSGTINIANRSGISGTALYNRAQKIGAKFSIIINYQLTNDTGSSGSFGATLECNISSLTTPVASQIYDFKNRSAHETFSPHCLVASAPVFVTKTIDISSPLYDEIPQLNGTMMVIARGNYNQLYVILKTTSPITLDDGESMWVSSRLELDLL